MAGSRGKCYPASQPWQEPGADGKPRYGRDSALKAIPELRDSDLIRFTFYSIADFERILDHMPAIEAAECLNRSPRPRTDHPR
jgi:hypothetical protein